MRSETLARTVLRCLQEPDDPAGGTASREQFKARFGAELQRLEKARRGVDGWEAERLASALGAAGVHEWELALAFLATAARPEPARRRGPAIALNILRRRFQLVMS